MSQITAQGGQIKKKQNPFSQVSNHPLRNPELSLRAKGLYALIQSYINIPNFILYKSALQNMCSEGRDAFESAWKELKNSGYLIQNRITVKGRFSYEYELLDFPNPDATTTSNNNNSDTEIPHTENPSSVKPGTEKPVCGKPVDLIRKINNNKLTKESFIQSKYSNSNMQLDQGEKNEGMNLPPIETIEQAIINNRDLNKFSYFDYIEYVKNQIDFDRVKSFAFYASECNRENATMEWVKLIADLYISEDDLLYIGKAHYRMSTVKQKLMLIDWSQMIGIFSNFTKLSSEKVIRNPKNYMIASLLNASSSSGLTAMAIEESSY